MKRLSLLLALAAGCMAGPDYKAAGGAGAAELSWRRCAERRQLVWPTRTGRRCFPIPRSPG